MIHPLNLKVTFSNFLLFLWSFSVVTGKRMKPNNEIVLKDVYFHLNLNVKSK